MTDNNEVYRYQYKDFDDCFPHMNVTDEDDCENKFPIAKWVTVKIALNEQQFTLAVDGVEHPWCDEARNLKNNEVAPCPIPEDPGSA